MTTCLFTREPLSDDTTQEHAPPLVFGGRFKSRTCVSSAFNNASSDLDRALIQDHYWVLNELFDLMPSDARSRGLGSKVAYALDGDDNPIFGTKLRVLPGMTMVGMERPVQFDADGKLDRIVARDKEHAEQLGASLAQKYPGVREMPVLADVPDPRKQAWTPERLLCPAAEVGALKALLEAFDIAHDSAPGTWVRSAATEPVRELVRRVVEGNSITPDDLSTFVVGIEPGQRDRVLALVKRHEKGFQRFHHAFVVSGSTGTRRIDACWLAFGEEPHTFILSNHYYGESFTEIVGFDPFPFGARWGPHRDTRSWQVDRRGLGTAMPVSFTEGRRLLPYVVIQGRNRLRGEARVRAIESRGADLYPRKCSNALIRLRKAKEPEPERLGDLVVAMLTPMWPSDLVGEAMAQEPAANTPIEAPADLPAFGPPLPWEAAGNHLYVSAVRRLYRDHGPPAVFQVGELIQSVEPPGAGLVLHPPDAASLVSEAYRRSQGTEVEGAGS